MFFFGLSFCLIFLIAGVMLLIKESFVVGGVLLAIGIISFIILSAIYNRKSKRSRSDCIDCSFVPDCKFPDTDCDGKPDCTPDCTPDCSH